MLFSNQLTKCCPVACGLSSLSCLTFSNSNCDRMEEDTKLFFESVRTSKLEEIKECLNRGVDVNSKHEGNNALHLAVYLHKPGFDATNLVRFLLQKGIDADLGNNRGNTALHTACRKDFQDIAETLLKFGVDKDRRNNKDESALYNAAELGLVGITKLLLQFGATATEKKDELLVQNLKSLKILVNNGLNTDTILISGETFLTFAIKYGNYDVAEFLIENRAPINKSNSLNENPLTIALSNKMLKLVILLIEKGAVFDVEKDNLIVFLSELDEKGESELLVTILSKATMTSFANKEILTLIFQTLDKARFMIFEKLVRKYPDLWLGIKNKENNTQQEIRSTKGKPLEEEALELSLLIKKKKKGLRDLRSTKEKLLAAILKAIEKDNVDFLTYVFHSMSIQDQSVLFSPELGIHHLKNKGMALIQVLAEKGE